MVTVTTLVSAPFTGASDANGINDAGEVVGQEDVTFPFVWQPTTPNGTTGTATRLPILPTGANPGTATAFAINNSGVIAGTSDALDASGNLVTRAVRWTGGAIQELGTLMPDPFNPGAFLGSSRALDINDLGQIVGASDTVLGVEHAFLFDPTLGFMGDLGALSPPVPVASRATSINNNGEIVGVSGSFDPNGTPVERAFLLLPGNPLLIDLGSLIPDPNTPGGFLGNSSAFGINDHFRIIGTSDVAGVGPGGLQLTGSVAFNSGGAPTPLLPVHSNGYDVGPTNRVVGSFDSPGRGFVFHASTGMVDLTVMVATSGMAITLGTGVNTAGQITAMADVAGSPVGVLITP
jgi:probable HAF family extracellular repeat protein